MINNSCLPGSAMMVVLFITVFFGLFFQYLAIGNQLVANIYATERLRKIFLKKVRKQRFDLGIGLIEKIVTLLLFQLLYSITKHGARHHGSIIIQKIYQSLFVLLTSFTYPTTNRFVNQVVLIID